MKQNRTEEEGKVNAAFRQRYGLQYIRQALGVTRERLSNESGVSLTCISSMERDREFEMNITIDGLHKMMDAVNGHASDEQKMSLCFSVFGFGYFLTQEERKEILDKKGIDYEQV